ncbi:MAG TPA: DUF6325 family protein [Gaiellaceae bacterium]|jgi:hypothetical protein
MTEIGPVEYMIVAFPGNKFRGEIAPALADLVESETIRIIDLTFVGKNAEGETISLELNDIDPEIRDAFESAGREISGLFSEEDLQLAAESLPPNSSAALLLWENLWATELAQAIRNAEGEILQLQRIPHDVVVEARELAKASATA